MHIFKIFGQHGISACALQHYSRTTARSLPPGYAQPSMSGLLLSAGCGDVARMKQLLAEGANIAELDENGWGVIRYAAYNA
jgi:hypothetical protein